MAVIDPHLTEQHGPRMTFAPAPVAPVMAQAPGPPKMAPHIRTVEVMTYLD